MANYYGTARSNYFAVKDRTAFDDAMASIEVEIIEKDGLVGLLSVESDGAGWQSGQWSDEANDYIEIDIVDLVSPHIADGHVAVFVEAGAEKMRYVVGEAIAVNNEGERRSIYLSEIYELAKDLGEHITQAEY